jgi:oligopeptide/dipeptide ABC transporter ATP-binding protein
MVQQDPFSGFDPRRRVSELLREPLDIFRQGTVAEREAVVRKAVQAVGLSEAHLDRLPHELSGGQLQRVSIARAFLLEPQLVVLDEPVSALDVSIQAQVVNLLVDLQQERDTSYLFITHDLGVLRHVAHRVAVMYLGRIVELGTVDQLFESPAHPYTKALLDAAPVPDPFIERGRERLILRGELPDPRNQPVGCAFAARCWLREQLGNPESCVTERPVAQPVADGHEVACHFPDSISEPAAA